MIQWVLGGLAAGAVNGGATGWAVSGAARRSGKVFFAVWGACLLYRLAFLAGGLYWFYKRGMAHPLAFFVPMVIMQMAVNLKFAAARTR